MAASECRASILRDGARYCARLLRMTSECSPRRLDRALAIDRDPFGLLLERLDAELGVKLTRARRRRLVERLRQQLERALEQHAHAVVLPRLRLQGELVGISVEHRGEARQ